MSSSRVLARRLMLVSVLVVAGPTLSAIFVRSELETVPVDRLIANLTQKVARAPQDAAAHAQLARVHAMAASGIRETPVAQGSGEPFFGDVPGPFPAPPRPLPSDPAERRRAQQHYVEAIRHYREALALDPSDLTVRLGYAWTLDQSGDQAAAIGEYRAVIEKAWAKEQNLGYVGPGREPLVVEAAQYLIKLLDPVKDAREIAILGERTSKLSRLPRAITPIAIPLRGGVSPDAFLDRAAGVAFDADGTGLARRWTWITPDAAWLVHDPAGTGRITSALHLFGSVTFWMFWADGYEALAALDDDADGELRGGELAGLALWRDRDGDGVSDPGEVEPVSAHGIIALACAGRRSAAADVAAYAPAGVRFADGSTRPTYDVVLRARAPATDETGGRCPPDPLAPSLAGPRKAPRRSGGARLWRA